MGAPTKLSLGLHEALLFVLDHSTYSGDLFPWHPPSRLPSLLDAKGPPTPGSLVALAGLVHLNLATSVAQAKALS